MESILIWIITGMLIIMIFIPYFMKFRKRQKKTLTRRKEAERLGSIKPRAQFPMIDASKCIGCGSCVAACPEEEVLGVVYGKAMIINGLRCVGHGNCEAVCPVMALKVGLGDITTRDDIPILDEYYQTNVPGLYVVGELGGLSLIRNAISQGKAAVEKIVDFPLRSVVDKVSDVLIVGAGPAGLSAALTAAKNRLSYTLLDQQDAGGTILQYPRRKLVMTQPVEIPLYGQLKNPEYTKEELLDIWREIIDRNGIEVNSDHKVDRVFKKNGFFEIGSARGMYQARNVVLALGRRGTPRKLKVPGEDRVKVTYQLVDAQSYTNNHILVVGGGDSAVEAAIGLSRQKGNTVTVSYRKNKFFRIKKKNEERINTRIKQKKIQPLFNSNVLEIKERSVVLDADGETIEIPNDYVFIFAGGIPPFKMLKEMGIAFGGEAEAFA